MYLFRLLNFHIDTYNKEYIINKIDAFCSLVFYVYTCFPKNYVFDKTCFFSIFSPYYSSSSAWCYPLLDVDYFLLLSRFSILCSFYPGFLRVLNDVFYAPLLGSFCSLNLFFYRFQKNNKYFLSDVSNFVGGSRCINRILK